MTQELSFGIVIAQHHSSWETLVARWQAAEQLGFDSVWIFDHFNSLDSDDSANCFEASTSLAALAMLTTRIRIGVLVYGVTHRIPTVLAKEMVTIDHMSNGRLIFGIGAAWNEPEHKAFAIPFPPPGDRVGVLDEALEIIKRLETEERVSYNGSYYTLENTPFMPKPVHGHMPLMIGGEKPRMLNLIARHADYWDTSLKGDDLKPGIDRMAERCREVGRDPSDLTVSIGVRGDGVTTDSQFAAEVRTAYRAGARMMIMDYPRDPAGEAALIKCAETVVPDLRADLTGR